MAPKATDDTPEVQGPPAPTPAPKKAKAKKATTPTDRGTKVTRFGVTLWIKD